MSFTQTQVRKLRAKLKPQHIRTREADGITLSYLEGWHVIAEANRVFGFEGWDRETVSSDCVWTKQVNGRYCAAYVCRIRVRVRAGDVLITREGSGAGESNAATPGQAHEFAAKAAETDATKRALMTFGNAFGLSLYAGTPEAKPKAQVPVSTQEQPARRSFEGITGPNPSEEAQHPPTSADQVASEEGQAAPASARLEDQPSLPVSLPGPDWPQIRPLEEAERLNRERVDKSALAVSEPKRIRNSGHLAFVASRPCLICGRNRAHAHHLKFAQPTALGRKVSDEFTVPRCPTHHRELHQHGDERTWWEDYNIDPIKVAATLWLSRRSSNTSSGPPSSRL